jgi:hypothetical protein
MRGISLKGFIMFKTVLIALILTVSASAFAIAGPHRVEVSPAIDTSFFKEVSRFENTSHFFIFTQTSMTNFNQSEKKFAKYVEKVCPKQNKNQKGYEDFIHVSRNVKGRIEIICPKK